MKKGDKNMELRDYILVQRVNAGLTRRDLAIKTGLDNNDITRIEAGTREPTIEELEAISESIEIPDVCKYIV